MKKILSKKELEDIIYEIGGDTGIHKITREKIAGFNYGSALTYINAENGEIGTVYGRDYGDAATKLGNKDIELCFILKKYGEEVLKERIKEVEVYYDMEFMINEDSFKLQYSRCE